MNHFYKSVTAHTQLKDKGKKVKARIWWERDFQWLRLQAQNAVGTGSVSSQRSHMPHSMAKKSFLIKKYIHMVRYTATERKRDRRQWAI